MIVSRLRNESGYAAFLRGIFAPFFRASESPMAMACLRLLTFPPLPPWPLFKVPCFFLRIALSTDLPAALPYFRPLDFFPDFFLAAIVHLLVWLVEGNTCKGCHVDRLRATVDAARGP